MAYYAVYKGKKPGIYETWKDCESQVKGYSGAVYKKFKDIHQANIFLTSGVNSNVKQKSGETIISEKLSKTESKPETILVDNYIYVYTDGSLIRKNNSIYGGYGIYIPKKHLQLDRRIVGAGARP